MKYKRQQCGTPGEGTRNRVPNYVESSKIIPERIPRDE